MIEDLKNKNIIIFGATSGIGNDLSLLLNKLDVNLILVAKNRSNLESLSDRLKKKVKIFQCDFNDYKKIQEVFKKISNLKCNIAGMVYVAGTHLIKPIATTDEKDLNDLININFVAPYLIIKEFSSKISKTESSSIVLVSSISAFSGQSALTAYSSTKGAIVSLTKSAAIEMSRNKIRVNCVAPGHIEGTKMSNQVKDLLTNEQYDKLLKSHPLGTGKPVDVAYCIAYLLSNKSKWMTGSIIKIDGGFSVG